MIITIPFKTPTINHLYWHRGNVKILTSEAKKLREKIEVLCTGMTEPEIHGIPLKVRVEIHEEWYCQNGSVKKRDIANREKFLVDSVFKAIGIDDKFIFELTMVKVQPTRHAVNNVDYKVDEKAVVTIEVIDDSSL